MSEFRDLQAKLQQIEESYFSDLDLELQEFRRANKDLPADKLVALAREKYGQEAASFISNQIEAEYDLADYEASDPQPHMRDPHPSDPNWPHPVEEGATKDMLWDVAAEMEYDEFVGIYGEQMGEFWDNVHGTSKYGDWKDVRETQKTTTLTAHLYLMIYMQELLLI